MRAVTSLRLSHTAEFRRGYLPLYTHTHTHTHVRPLLWKTQRVCRGGTYPRNSDRMLHTLIFLCRTLRPDENCVHTSYNETASLLELSNWLTIKILYFAFVRYLVYLQGKGGGLFYEMRNISIPRRIIKRDCLSVRTFQLRWRAHPLHRYEFVPPKSFSKTFNFSIIFYSTCKISGRGQFRKECRSRKKNRNHWKSRTNSRTLLEPFLRSRKEKKLQGNWVTSNSQRILSKGSAL